MSHHFNQEFLILIPVKLPVSSLARFTAVCKEWRELIKSSYFISAHLDYVLSSNTSPITFWKHRTRTSNIESFCFNSDSAMNIVSPFHNGNQFVLDVIGSIHGLLCLSSIETSVYFVLNPKVGKFIQFHTKESTKIDEIVMPPNLGFGFDSKEKDYKVVMVYCITKTQSKFPETKASVYALKDKQWRDVNSGDLLDRCCLNKGVACFCERLGSLHWLAFCGWKKFIMCFDLVSEIFCRMRLPECLEQVSILVRTLFLGKICGSLAVIQAKQKEYKTFQGIDVWVRKDCVWNKVYVVDDISGTLCSLIGLSGSGSGLLLAIDGKESDESELVEFDLKSNRTKKLGITSAVRDIYAGSYIDSLLLFNDDSGAISCKEIMPKETPIDVEPSIVEGEFSGNQDEHVLQEATEDLTST